MNKSSYQYSALERTHFMLLIIEWIYNAISLVSSIYFVQRLSRIPLIHVNLRIQLCSIALQYTVIFTTRIADFINVGYAEKPRIVTNILCVLIGVFNGASIFSCVITIVNIAVERWLATLLKDNYEMRSHGIGLLILVFTILIGVFVSIGGFVYDIRMGNFDLWTSTDSCFAVHLHPQLYPLAWITASVCCFSGSLYNENMITTKALAPAISGYALFCVPGVLLSVYTTYLMLRDGEHDTFVQLLLQILYMMADAYQMFFIIYITFNYLPLRNVVRRDVCKVLKIFPSSRVNEEGNNNGSVEAAYKNDREFITSTYFNELEKSWSILPLKRKH